MATAAARWMKPALSKPAEPAREERRPARVGELERHAGEREADEAHDHDDVQRAVEPREALVLEGLRLTLPSIRSSPVPGFVPPASGSVPPASGSLAAGGAVPPGLLASALGALLRLPPAPRPPRRPSARASGAPAAARAACGRRRRTKVPISSEVMPQKVQKSQGYFCRVVVRRVAQVAGEAARRARVALLAGLDHVLAREVRARVGHRQDVVRAVAVVALGGLRVAELARPCRGRCRSRSSRSPVAAAALLHDVELEALGVGAADRVRAVAVVADRQLLVGLRPPACGGCSARTAPGCRGGTCRRSPARSPG